MNNSNVCVFQDWLFNLPMQMQSVLVLACRGPDNVAKTDPTKRVVQRYRATVFKAAYLGRPMKVDEFDETSFMSLRHFSDDESWGLILRDYFENVDALPHHYHMHLMHGAQIASVYHPVDLFRSRWGVFYYKACADLHLTPETDAQLRERLNDWNQQHWNVTQAAE